MAVRAGCHGKGSTAPPRRRHQTRRAFFTRPASLRHQTRFATSPDTLRFVTKGKKGTITYVVKIDTKAETARWTIASGTRAYKGLHGKGIESENASFTVSTLTGTVWR